MQTQQSSAQAIADHVAKNTFQVTGKTSKAQPAQPTGMGGGGFHPSVAKHLQAQEPVQQR